MKTKRILITLNIIFILILNILYLIPSTFAVGTPNIVEIHVSSNTSDSFGTTPVEVTAGGTFKLWYLIHNPNNIPIKVGLGASIRSPEISDRSGDQAVTLPAGPNNFLRSRLFTVPSTCSAGLKDVAFGLWDENFLAQYPGQVFWRTGWLNVVAGKQSSSVSITASPSTATVGQSITISGTISPGHATTVTITSSHRNGGTSSWQTVGTPSSNSAGGYSFSYTPTFGATYDFKASWGGDSDHNGAESNIASVSVVQDGASIVSFTPPSGSVQRSSTVSARVRVRNTGSSTRSFWVGLTWWDSARHTFNVAPKQTSSISPSGEAEVSFSWSIPGDGVSDGACEIYTAVWAGYDGSSMISPKFDEEDRLGAFTILPTTTDGASVISFTPPSGSIKRDATASASVRIRNTGSSTRSFWVGLSWWDSAGTKYDVTPKQTQSLSPGGETIVSFDWTIPQGVSDGPCDVLTAVWSGYDRSNMVLPKFDQREQQDAFMIPRTIALEISNMMTDKQIYVSGETITFSFTVKNNGKSSIDFRPLIKIKPTSGLDSALGPRGISPDTLILQSGATWTFKYSVLVSKLLDQWGAGLYGWGVSLINTGSMDITYVDTGYQKSFTITTIAPILGISFDFESDSDNRASGYTSNEALDVMNNVVKLLIENGLESTIFVQGACLTNEQSGNAFQSMIISANKNGIEIGAHSFSHPEGLGLLQVEKITSEVTQTKSLIQNLIGKKEIGFRSPYFNHSMTLNKVLATQGFLYDSSEWDSRIFIRKVSGGNLLEVTWQYEDYDTVYSEYVTQLNNMIKTGEDKIFVFHAQKILNDYNSFVTMIKYIKELKDKNRITILSLNKIAKTTSLIGDSASIISFTPPSGSIKRGATASASVRIRNTGSTTRSFWVGLSWWDSAGNMHDITPKQSPSLSPGGEAALTFTWTIPTEAHDLTCDISTAIWGGYNGDKMTTPKFDGDDRESAFTISSITHDTISFSGYTWNVENSEVKTNPGPNYWSNNEENVWVDDAGQLHLRITYRNNAWYCAEVSTTQALGYGTYTYTTASRIDTIDKNAVLGLFAYKDDNHEIDIEYSKWGNSNNANAWYSIQPKLTDGSNVKSFNIALSSTYSTHSFTWSNSGVSFISLHGSYEPTNAPLTNIIQTWSSSLSREAEGAEAYINLWLNEGSSPSDGKEVEVVVKSFQFTPASSNEASIVSLTPPSGGYDREATASASVRIRNTGSSTRSFWVGLTWWDSAGTKYDITPKQTQTLSPGGETTLTFTWTIPQDASDGACNVLTAVWSGYSGGNMVSPKYDQREQQDAFTIPPNGAVIASLNTETIKIAATSTFKVKLSIDPGNYGISACQLDLNFDPTAMIITDMVLGDLLGNSPLKAIDTRDNQAGRFSIALARIGQTHTPTPPGVLLTITFKAVGKTGKDFIIQLTNIKLSDSKIQDINDITSKSCTIDIGSQIPEDLNGDDTIDYKDLAILGLSYGKSRGESGYNPTADINGDGRVDYIDLALLGAKYSKG